jgi:DNA-binding response OmpR family regulator
MQDDDVQPRPVLIVDDDALITASLGDLVRQSKFPVVTGRSAEEGEALLAQRPWLAFIDVTLPKDQGDMLCRKIRLKPETWDLPVVMITASQSPSVIRRCLMAGADDFALKPLEPHQVLGKIESVRRGLNSPFAGRMFRKRLLIATENEFFRSTVGRLAYQSGCEVEYPLSQDDLVQALKRTEPKVDLVVVDMDLPGPDELTGLLKQLAAQSVPFITMGTAATIQARVPKWAATAPLAWTTLAPYDVEEERDDIVRHVSRMLSLGVGRVDARRSARVRFSSAVRFRFAGTQAWMVGFSFDVSESGIFVRTLDPLEPSRAPVELCFKLTETGETLDLRGVVVWSVAFGQRHVSTVPYGMGLSFTEMSSKAAEQLRAFVTQRIREATTVPGPQ